MQVISVPWWSHPDRPCRGRTAEWFMDDVYLPRWKREARMDALVQECMTCPVLAECREDALSRPHLTLGVCAVQGGMTPKEQDDLRS